MTLNTPLHPTDEQTHELDEYLELLFHLQERHELSLAALEKHLPEFRPRVVERLADLGLVTVEADALGFTDKGFLRATQIIRRHRLAERLLTDVLHMSPAEVEQGACEFEHVVAEEITESICTLLGHPRTCPHGSPIPEGPCCKASARECRSAVIPLTEAPVGRWARVAYVNAISDERLHRLAHFGIIPGNKVKLHQLKPSVVVLVESSRLAMEEAIARDILVWRKNHDELEPEAKSGRGLSFWRR
jgi:DtxR family Mn-dependent transcriptional regulator